jgi:hypothetical protein
VCQCVVDEFAQESYSDESLNINRVLSWRMTQSAAGHEPVFVVQYDANWFFCSERSGTPPDRRKELLVRLRNLDTRPVLQP